MRTHTDARAREIYGHGMGRDSFLIKLFSISDHMDETKEQAVVNGGQEHPLGRQTICRDSLEHRLVAANTSGYRSG